MLDLSTKDTAWCLKITLPIDSDTEPLKEYNLSIRDKLAMFPSYSELHYNYVQMT